VVCPGGYSGIVATGRCKWCQIFIPLKDSIRLTLDPKRVQSPTERNVKKVLLIHIKRLMEYENKTYAIVWHKIKNQEICSFFIYPKTSPAKILILKTGPLENFSPSWSYFIYTRNVELPRPLAYVANPSSFGKTKTIKKKTQKNSPRWPISNPQMGFSPPWVPPPWFGMSWSI